MRPILTGYDKMKKYFYLALVCLASVVTFTACNKNGNNNPDKDGSWYTSASQIDVTAFDDKDSKCWAIDIWCDGTTIGRQYEWGSEASVAAAAKLILTMDYQVYGYQTKKVKWFEADANDADACHAQVWEGAVCWEETVSYNGSQSETNFGWMPEANMKERHDYYESKGLTHTYTRAAAEDEDACNALNEQNPDTTVVPPVDPYANLDSITFKCWKYTIGAYGATSEGYEWMTEKMLVIELDKLGIQYTYEATNITDKDGCHAPEDDEDAHCWKVTITKGNATEIYYFWGFIEDLPSDVTDYPYTYELTEIEDMDGCEDMNPNTSGYFCWEVTVHVGVDITNYRWDTEEGMAQYIQMVEQQGLSVTYQKNDAHDEYACEALNNQ